MLCIWWTEKALVYVVFHLVLISGPARTIQFDSFIALDKEIVKILEWLPV